MASNKKAREPEKELPPLEPVDKDRCQAEKPNGVTFMTLGGKFEMVRCKNKPKVVATEVKPGKDGRIGAMSLCGDCLVVFQKQMGPGYATFEVIEGGEE